MKSIPEHSHPDPLEDLRAWAAEESLRPVRATPALIRLKADLAREAEARTREARVAGAALLLAFLALIAGASRVPGLPPGTLGVLGLLGGLALARLEGPAGAPRMDVRAGREGA